MEGKKMEESSMSAISFKKSGCSASKENRRYQKEGQEQSPNMLSPMSVTLNSVNITMPRSQKKTGQNSRYLEAEEDEKANINSIQLEMGQESKGNEGNEGNELKKRESQIKVEKANESKMKPQSGIGQTGKQFYKSSQVGNGEMQE